MFDSLVNQYYTMTLWEELHTIGFTVFIVSGAICCFLRSGRPAMEAARPLLAADTLTEPVRKLVRAPLRKARIIKPAPPSRPRRVLALSSAARLPRPVPQPPRQAPSHAAFRSRYAGSMSGL